MLMYMCLPRLAAAKTPMWKALNAATEVSARFRLQFRRQRRAAPSSSTCYRNDECGALCERVLFIGTQFSNHFTNHFSQSWRCSTFYAKRPMSMPLLCLSCTQALWLYTRYSLRYSMHELPFGSLKCAMMGSKTGTLSSRIRSHTRSLLRVLLKVLHELWRSNRSFGSCWRSMIF